MRVVVMGSGGTGGYFGAKLARAGEDVTFVARGAHLEAILARGLRVKSALEGEWVVRAPPEAWTSDICNSAAVEAMSLEDIFIAVVGTAPLAA